MNTMEAQRGQNTGMPVPVEKVDSRLNH